MDRRNLHALVFSSIAVVACSSATSPTPTDDSGLPTASSVPSADICSFFLAKNCPGVENTAAHQSACQQAYDVAATRGCKSFIDDGWSCLSSKDESALTCTADDVYVTDPTCAQPAIVMEKCVVAVNDPQCYGGACKSFADCPSGWSCNEALGQCYDDSHACLGAPCKSFADCSSGTTCNSALEVCTKS